LALAWIAALGASRALAQQPAPLTFSSYLVEVARGNASLAAQQTKLPLAQAQVVLARVFPDPVLTGGLSSWEVSGQGAQNGLTASVAVPLEWPGKRGARTELAQANVSAPTGCRAGAAQNLLHQRMPGAR
jgi:cobalt-zinc-cadmium efflux system outer membrane protein